MVLVITKPLNAGQTKGSVWEAMKELQDPELRGLAGELLDTVLHSRADSTTKKYIGAFHRWETWAQAREEVTVLPVREVHLALYLQHVGAVTRSKSAVEEAVHAISWVHQISGLPSVTESPFVRSALAGLQRKLAKPKTKKEPVTQEMLAKMVDSLAPDPSLSDVRLVASALLAFAAFLRYDELAKLRCCDVTIKKDSMEVHIVSSKTDQYPMGDKVLVARTGSRTCPVQMMERYI